MRQDPGERNKTDDGAATFEDFINFLVYGNGLAADAHWRTYTKQCYPCVHSYDYILKLETVDDDVRYLKENRNLSEEHKAIFFPPQKYKSQSELVKKTFSKIPRETLSKLYEFYKVDFHNSGYEKPKWL